MFSENNKVSGKQIRKMLVFDMLSISILVIPGLAAVGAGRDGVFAIILAALAALVYGCFFLSASKRIKGEYIGFCTQVTGKVCTFIIGVLYLVKLIFSCWFTLSLFCSVINETLLPDTNVKVILLTFVLVGLYMARKGIEVRARVTEILFYLVLIPLFFIFLIGLKNIDVTNLFPLFTSGRTDVIKTSYLVLLSFSPLELLLFALPYVTNQDSKENTHKKGVILAVVISTVINLILFVLILGMLGIRDAGQQFDSSIAILQVIEIPIGVVKRQDAIVLLFWLMSIFTMISAYFFYMTSISMKILNGKSKRGYDLFFGVLIFILSLVHLSPDKTIAYYTTYMAYIGMPQSVLIPLIVFFIAKVRRVVGGKDVRIGAEDEA